MFAEKVLTFSQNQEQNIQEESESVSAHTSKQKISDGFTNSIE